MTSIIVSIVTAISTGIISYLASIYKAKTELENSKIQADNEISKIKENANAEIQKVQETMMLENERIKKQYEFDLEKLKRETDEKIRLMSVEKDLEFKQNQDAMANQFAMSLMSDPSQISSLVSVLEELPKIQKQMDQINRKKQ